MQNCDLNDLNEKVRRSFLSMGRAARIPSLRYRLHSVHIDLVLFFSNYLYPSNLRNFPTRDTNRIPALRIEVRSAFTPLGYYLQGRRRSA